MGADVMYSARAMMMALGCIQALRCNTNACPTGVTTHDPNLVAGLVVKDKRARVASFHRETLASVGEILGAMGLKGSDELRPWHIMRRISETEVRHYGELFEYLDDGCLLKEESLPATFARACRAATAQSFRHAESQTVT